MILVLLVIVKIVLADDKSIIVHGNSTTELDRVQFAYKSVYGIPKKLLCDESITKQFYECERTAHHTWEITVNDYFYEKSKFCCFIWLTLSCEMDVIKKCSVDYLKKLEMSTKQSYKSMCERIGSGPNSYTCFMTKDTKATINWIIAILILILTLACASYGIRTYCNKNEDVNQYTYYYVTDPDTGLPLYLGPIPRLKIQNAPHNPKYPINYDELLLKTPQRPRLTFPNFETDQNAIPLPNVAKNATPLPNVTNNAIPLPNVANKNNLGPQKPNLLVTSLKLLGHDLVEWSPEWMWR
ncbi:hypothetical protein DERF_014466 [Dermatophagoides farinae]|uniref:Uncharacterized protein n=1 Tax=Dermatophagoides farinae TaxID=6954 RepID=A0A922HP62_DERFA|nr:hypothetical protein DERF_014466 [Dermatophagoides farinae]